MYVCSDKSLNNMYYPKIDTLDELDIDGIKQFQSMIGALQWVVQIGQFDITTAIMTLS